MSKPWRALLALILALAPALAAAKTADPATTWRLLDYIAVDYGGAVSSGRVVDPGEYAEMREFAATVEQQIRALPHTPGKRALEGRSRDLSAAIAAKAPPAKVAGLARGLGADLLRDHPVALGPRQPPDLARGAELYAQNCASCHGATGAADTPVARQLDPPPIAFTDRSRAAERTPFALYQVIDQGLEGTAMASFSSLPAEDKWALAYHASRLAYPAGLASEGKQAWEAEPRVRGLVPGLEELSNLSEQDLARTLGTEQAAALLAYLRSNPEAVVSGPKSLELARQRLAESVAAYERGDPEGAARLALSAYLDGFEPIEPAIGARDSALLAEVERAMAGLRSAIAAGRPAAEVRERAADVSWLFDRSDALLAADSGTAISAFVGGFTILLREGLEALLIVIAMLAFLRKADRADMARPVHYGWASALVAGGLTWWAATSLIGISGAGRELTEGFGSLLAAAVLLLVGIWMHGKSQAGEWQRYIRDRMGQALSGRSAGFLFGLSFIAVYREVFETILFYAAMAAQGHVGALAAGGLAGVLVLAAVAVAMLRFSHRLPIGKFFAFSSALVAVLAVVLAGKGIAALQEAGMLAVDLLPSLPRAPILGLYPTFQTVAAQLSVLAILLAGFLWNRRRMASAATA